ncbi:MAG: DUF3500 domain-containing protein [Gemmataceae bacterium]
MRSGRLFLSLALILCVAGVALVAQKLEPPGAKMTSAAEKFLATLKDDQKTKAVFDFDAKERSNWHFIPLQTKDKQPSRQGLGLYDMTEEQRKAALELVRAGTSMTGYDKAVTIMSLEGILRDLEKNGAMVRNPQWYFFSVFGKPAATGKWGWRVEGHHLSLNFVIEDNKVVGFTPAFFGANPAVVMAGDKKGLRTLPGCEEFARALIKSLDEDQKKLAYQDKQLPEIEQGKVSPALGAPIGVPASKLNDKQKATLTKLLEAYTSRMPAEVAEVEMAEVKKAGLDKIYFAYAGNPEPGKPYTYRVHGPTFAVEFLNTQPDSAGNPANHIHSAWRKIGGDFGVKK